MQQLVNIGIDDYSPHPQSGINVLEQCFKLIDKFSDIKFTLFIPTAYWRTVDNNTWEQPLLLAKNQEFCNITRQLPNKNFELGFHGLFHGIPGKSNNDEYRNRSKDELMKITEQMIRNVFDAGLEEKFKMIFRPPGWRMCPDGFEALSAYGFDLFALSDINYAIDSYNGKDKEYACTYSNIMPPFKPLEQHDKMIITTHACVWDGNYLSDSMAQKFISFFKNSDKDIKFVFQEGLL